MNYLVLIYTDPSEFQECSARILRSFCSGLDERGIEMIVSLLGLWFDRSDHVAFFFQDLDNAAFSKKVEAADKEYDFQRTARMM